MADNKKSFILYADLIHTFEKLPDEIAGKLMKIILNYVNDKNPAVDDLLLQIAFEPIKLQLKRDLMKWDEFKKRQSENGKMGGRPAKKRKPKNPSLLNESQKSLNDTVTVNVNENDNDNKNENNLGKSENPLKIEKNNFPFPTPEDVKNLPKPKINSTIEILKITAQVILKEPDVLIMWEAFKHQNLTGKRYYLDEDAVESHFMNWIKKTDFKKIQNHGSFKTSKNSKSAGTYELLSDIKSNIGIN